MQLKLLIRVLFCLVLVACKTPPQSKPPAQHIEFGEQLSSYSNPVLINGSTFAHYFQSLYRLGLYNDMLKFTSTGTVQQFGKSQVLDYYQSKLKFDFEIGKLTSVLRRDDTLELRFTYAQINATRRMIRIMVLVEGDSCKVVLHNLNSNPFY